MSSWEQNYRFHWTAAVVAVFAMVADVVSLNVGDGRHDGVPLVTLGVSQVLIVALWFGLGRTPLWLRFAWLMFTIVGWSLARFRFAENMGIFSLLAAYPLVIALILRSRGVRVRCLAEQEAPPARRSQFSLRQAFAWTTIAAIVAAVVHYNLIEIRIQSAWEFLWQATLLVAPTFFAVGLILSQSSRARVVFASGIALTLLVDILFTNIPFPKDRADFLFYSFLQGLAAAVVLLPFRILGYRVVWRNPRMVAEVVEEPEQASGAHPLDD